MESRNTCWVCGSLNHPTEDHIFEKDRKKQGSEPKRPSVDELWSAQVKAWEFNATMGLSNPLHQIDVLEKIHKLCIERASIDSIVNGLTTSQQKADAAESIRVIQERINTWGKHLASFSGGEVKDSHLKNFATFSKENEIRKLKRNLVLPMWGAEALKQKIRALESSITMDMYNKDIMQAIKLNDKVEKMIQKYEWRYGAWVSETRICWRCGAQGSHTELFCPRGPTEKKATTLYCDICENFGHVTKMCQPSKQTSPLVITIVNESNKVGDTEKVMIQVKRIVRIATAEYIKIHEDGTRTTEIDHHKAARLQKWIDHMAFGEEDYIREVIEENMDDEDRARAWPFVREPKIRWKKNKIIPDRVESLDDELDDALQIEQEEYERKAEEKKKIKEGVKARADPLLEEWFRNNKACPTTPAPMRNIPYHLTPKKKKLDDWKLTPSDSSDSDNDDDADGVKMMNLTAFTDNNLLDEINSDAEKMMKTIKEEEQTFEQNTNMVGKIDQAIGNFQEVLNRLLEAKVLVELKRTEMEKNLADAQAVIKAEADKIKEEREKQQIEEDARLAAQKQQEEADRLAQAKLDEEKREIENQQRLTEEARAIARDIKKRRKQELKIYQDRMFQCRAIVMDRANMDVVEWKEWIYQWASTIHIQNPRFDENLVSILKSTEMWATTQHIDIGMWTAQSTINRLEGKEDEDGNPIPPPTRI